MPGPVLPPSMLPDVGPDEITSTGDDRDPAELLADGDCPWCADYDGDHPGRHASKAHPDEWQSYSRGE